MAVCVCVCALTLYASPNVVALLDSLSLDVETLFSDIHDRDRAAFH